MDIQHTEDYRQIRAKEYPPMQEQLDALWHAMDAGILPMVPAFYDPIKTVKERLSKAALKVR